MEYKIKNKKKQELIKRGVDPKLFSMPAINEKVQYLDIAPNNMKIHEDGTFDIGNYTMQTVKKDGEDVIALIEYNLENRKTANPALKGQEAYNEYGDIKSHDWPIASLIYVDKDGFETQKTQIGLKDKKEIVSLEDFEKRPIEREYIRKDGVIKYYKAPTEYSEQGFFAEYYDNGSYEIDKPSLLRSNKNKNFINRNIGSFEDATNLFDANAEKVTYWYPDLEESVKNRRATLEQLKDQKYEDKNLALSEENATMRDQNRKLKKMLDRSLTFADTVKHSVVGKMFFGKKVKETLGVQSIEKEADKNASDEYKSIQNLKMQGVNGYEKFLKDENTYLKENTEKLQSMLQKSITFADEVRHSTIGKIFFGKEADNLLGNQAPEAKEIPDER